jgi:chromosome partitioning protein
MQSILVANPKGGAGKTTFAVNLAAGLAIRGAKVTLCDLDRQRSALQWLGLRSAALPAISGVGVDGRGAGTREGGEGWMVVDSPAGLHGKNLAHAVKLSAGVLIPVQPSLFDMAATGEFLASLMGALGRKRRSIGIVGMRVDPRTRAAATLEAFLAQFELPVITYLRDTQLYPNAAFAGQSVFDAPEYVAAREIRQWEPVFEWMNGLG